MEKFRELLFLNSIQRVAKKTIYDKYWDFVVACKDLDDLVNKMKLYVDESKIKLALEKSEKIYDEVIKNPEIQVITVLDENYPEKLKVMGNERPLILYVKGNVNELNKENISIIGTRKPSELSQKFEKNLVKSIVNDSQRVVVSGLALGCDKIAHQTTVEEGKITIAILPSGVNVIKPVSNKDLAENIIKTGGCLISEYEPNKNVNRGSYVERDKIVAAFCDATFVVECGVKSGTMHTVNAANDYKRQIYTYLPDEKSEGSYEGNEFILNEFEDSIMVEDIGIFIDDLKTIETKKQVKSTMSTLDDF